MPGKGSVYQRASDGRWVAQVEAGPVGGKRRYRRAVRATEAEALKALPGLRRSVKRGSRRTTGQFLDWWVSEVLAEKVATGDLSPRTMDSYADIVRLHLWPQVGRIPLDDLEAPHVARMMSAMRTAGLSPRTRTYALQVLSMALRLGVAWKMVEANVADAVDPPRQVKAAPAAATADQARLLIAKGSVPNLYATMIGTGARVGEALAIANTDIDGRVLTVGFSLSRRGRSWVRGPTKGRRPRAMPMAGFVVRALEVESAARDERAAELGDLWDPQLDVPLVFVREFGQPMHAKTINAALERDCEQLGLPRLTPHMLRKSCSSLLADAGVPARVRAEILGHRQVQLTEDTYTAVYDPALDEAVELLDEALG